MSSELATTPFGALRRKEREIASRAEIDAILGRAKVVHLGFADAGQPFVVPVFYVYEGGALYYHSAHKGTKMRFLERNPRVCFEVSVDQGIVEAPRVCDFEARHRTVIGFGEVSEVTDEAEKTRILGLLVKRLTGEPFALPTERVAGTAVCRVHIQSLSGKCFGF